MRDGWLAFFNRFLKRATAHLVGRRDERQNPEARGITEGAEDLRQFVSLSGRQ